MWLRLDPCRQNEDTVIWVEELEMQNQGNFQTNQTKRQREERNKIERIGALRATRCLRTAFNVSRAAFNYDVSIGYSSYEVCLYLYLVCPYYIVRHWNTKIKQTDYVVQMVKWN